MSSRVHRLLAVIRADVQIRLRRPSTAVIFVLLSAIPYLWIPDPATGRALMTIDGRRVLYNSAAVGTATAALGAMFIGLAGFYVVSNALRRDVLTRCGFVIASTTMRGSEYIAGKFAGNVVFLSIFTFGYMLTAMAMVVVRGEAPLEPLVFAKQYLLLLPPTIAAVSALAILFECTPLLRGKAGDVLYFFLWMGGMAAGASSSTALDFAGLGFVLQQMKAAFHTTSVTIGASDFDAARGIAVFDGLGVGEGWLLPRIAATLLPLTLLFVARLFFHRFDPARVRALPNEQTRRTWLGRLNALSKPFARLFVYADRLPGGASIPRAALTDAMATIAAFPLAAVAIIALAIASLTASPTAVLPFAFAACAVALADIASREKRAATTSLVFAMPGLRERFVLWKFLSTLYVALAFLAIPLARTIAARPSSALASIVGLLFLAAAATALGITSANPKTFLLAFLTFFYIAMSDKGGSPSLDFAGWNGVATPQVTAAYAALTLGFFALAYAFHAYDLRR
ncbi:MAG TPA: hypothetical protein VE974_11015 [Thermoanaerobaculia bacterium]|nr:hypothetical protein [Thermoanaerobaculia bacterium]